MPKEWLPLDGAASSLSRDVGWEGGLEGGDRASLGPWKKKSGRNQKDESAEQRRNEGAPLWPPG